MGRLPITCRAVSQISQRPVVTGVRHLAGGETVQAHWHDQHQLVHAKSGVLSVAPTTAPGSSRPTASCGSRPAPRTRTAPTAPPTCSPSPSQQQPAPSQRPAPQCWPSARCCAGPPEPPGPPTHRPTGACGLSCSTSSQRPPRTRALPTSAEQLWYGPGAARRVRPSVALQTTRGAGQPWMRFTPGRRWPNRPCQLAWR